MKIFNSKDKYSDYNIYSLKKYVNKKTFIARIIILIIIIILLCLTIYYLIDTKKELAKREEYEKQVLEKYQIQLELISKKEEAEKQTKIPKLTDLGKENIKRIYSSDKKRVFLTFDDGPSINTNYILDILNKYNIKATFFVLGTQVENMPDVTKRIYKEGHYIANHGYSHKYSKIYGSKENVLEEYNRCNNIVANTLEIPEYNSHLFRFPGGSIGGYYAKTKKEAVSLLEQNNIMHVDWNALTGDSEVVNPSEEYLNKNLINTSSGKQSVVILMHDSESKKATVDFLPKLIEFFLEQEYEFQNFYSIIK